jgi:hypothetical protein
MGTSKTFLKWSFSTEIWDNITKVGQIIGSIAHGFPRIVEFNVGSIASVFPSLSHALPAARYNRTTDLVLMRYAYRF